MGGILIVAVGLLLLVYVLG